MTSPPLTPHRLEPYEPPPPPHWGWRIAKGLLIAVLIVVVFFVGRDFAKRSAVQVSPDPDGGAVAAGAEVSVDVPPGATARAIATLLEDQGVVEDGSAFELAIRRSGRASELKAGKYVLIAGAGHDSLIESLVAGPAPVEVYRIQVVEGLRIEAMLDSVAEQTPYARADLDEVLGNGSVFSSFFPDEVPEGVPDIARWEGLLFSDTYEFRADATPAEILQRMARTLETRVDTIDWETFDLGELTRYEAIIIASLIEREAKLPEDRALISSVIHNRLSDGGLLQIDATVIYAIGENRGRVLDSDLEIDSPYNTYQISGLPPTPIGGVRRASIEAAANPADTEFRYYVLVDEDGSHGFSVTLEEHNAKVAAAREAGVLP
ncbi:MAG: endolytic transglycosylase MltG [Acidimicrobiia bacterium]